jgi:MoaA/NifB/PqqE/SkfB family radical SAM enzyme
LIFLKLKEEYKADYLRVRVSFVEQKDNFSEKEDFYNFWSKQKGVNVITFQKCLDYFCFDTKDEDSKLSKKELESKYKNEKPFFCAAPWETPIIQEDGKITPCGMPVREHNKDFILGDISKGDTIKESWCGEKMQKLRALHKKGEWYKENMCRVCVKMKRTAQHQEFQPNT